jgi:hypothetical protein
MSPEMTVLLPLLTTLIGALGGVWLGRYLEQGNETIKWRRDRLLDAYSEFLRAADVAVAASWEAFRTECETEEHKKQTRIAYKKASEMNRVSDRILLLSSDAVEPSFKALMLVVRSEFVFKLTACPKAPTQERKELNRMFREAWAAFVKSARHDLGIHPPS